jgi:hypothetical protein
MKIALCLSGQPRQISSNIEQLKKNLIIPSGIEDIFVHTWFDKNFVGCRFSTAQPHQSNIVGIWEHNTIDLIESLNPKKLIIEPPNEFSQFSHLESHPTAIQTQIASMMYSVYRANALKSEYEYENGFKYDLVIKTRFDILFSQSYNIANYLDIDWKNKIHASHRHQHMRRDHSNITTDGRTYYSVSDIFVYGSSDNMNKYCSVYPDFEKIYNFIKPYQYSEQYYGYQIRGGMWNLEISEQNIDETILRA